jgi:hypothetical protein
MAASLRCFLFSPEANFGPVFTTVQSREINNLPVPKIRQPVEKNDTASEAG